MFVSLLKNSKRICTSKRNEYKCDQILLYILIMNKFFFETLQLFLLVFYSIFPQICGVIRCRRIIIKISYAECCLSMYDNLRIIDIYVLFTVITYCRKYDSKYLHISHCIQHTQSYVLVCVHYCAFGVSFHCIDNKLKKKSIRIK